MIAVASKSSLPNEEYLRKRDELITRTKTKGGLVGWINRCLDDSVRAFSKSTVGAFGHGDWQNIKEILVQWEERGLLRIIKPIDEASDDDMVIEMLDYIDQKSPFPNWPIKPV
jgi:hypothetical protein